MASAQPPTVNGVVSAEPSVPTATTAEPAAPTSMSTEQLVAGEATETKGEEAEPASTEAPAAAETKEADEKEKELAEIKAKWPGWPGYTVFRIVVPVLKVGGIIGRKGDLIKKLVEDTRAKIRVLDGPITSPDRIMIRAVKFLETSRHALFQGLIDLTFQQLELVTGCGTLVWLHAKCMNLAYAYDLNLLIAKCMVLAKFPHYWQIFQVLISGKEEPEAALSPAMDAIIRIFKRVNGLPENDGDGQTIGAAGAAFCSIRLLVASTQAISLIGKQGSLIKSIQESTGASVRVLSHDEMPIYASSDERIVELQGEGLKVLKALEAVVGHLRKFLVDHSILPLFEKSYNAPATQERQQVDTWSDKTMLHQHATPQTSLGSDYPVPVKRDLYFDRETQIESHIPSSRLSSLYGSDHGLGSRSSTIGRAGGPVVTQVAQTMQIPLAYAEDIIGVQGANIDYIRRSSGAILTVQESRGLPEEITVEIKGTSSQVQAAQQLIQEFIGGHREQPASSYGNLESSLRQSYSQLGGSSYSSSSFSGQPYGGYGSSGVGGYSSFNRL
ncbi:hypothetical protein DH2020_034577 [Rehmannia glutinosa]|uniref:K Homology domain-containing protein n=1 Tax=Rehmannia glutinosa TaxID=99300 RepID=A0ABR0VB60_REHGL